jgi:hypothetical protein
MGVLTPFHGKMLRLVLGPASWLNCWALHPTNTVADVRITYRGGNAHDDP